MVALTQAVEPLLGLFAVCDDVFTEDDALAAHNQRVTLGRIYREWKKVRQHFDPEFERDAKLRGRALSVERDLG
jgi:hypothetical protein